MSKITVDFRELIEFQKGMQIKAETFDMFMAKFVEGLGNAALARTKALTPVDSGDLRRSWKISSIQLYGSTYEIQLSNNVMYAYYIEHGYTNKLAKRWMDGYFMMKMSVDELNEKVPNKWLKDFESWLREVVR